MAIDKNHRQKGLGSLLLADAITRSISSGMGVYAIIVDARDSNAISFYEHFGFQRFDQMHDVLYLPLSGQLDPNA